MKISRRDLLKYAGASAIAMGLSQLHLDRLEQVLANASAPPVLWLSGSACTGCSVSLLNAVNPTIDQVLLNTIDLRYHSTLMAAAGDMAVDVVRSTVQAGGYTLIVEGAIPTASNGRYCYVWDENGQPVTMAQAVLSLAANAAHIVAVGTCAAYGGIPAVYAGTSSQGLSAFLQQPVINLPGCPAHPDWIVGTLVRVLSGETLSLDNDGRPQIYYPQALHESCPRRNQSKARDFGTNGYCLRNLGCQGSQTKADCPTRLWNNQQNFCMGANGFCIGCTEPDFPTFPLHRT